MVSKYIPYIKEGIVLLDPQMKNRYFLSGSSTRKETFNGIDVAFIAEEKSTVSAQSIKEKIESTTIPYFVDVVDFNVSSEKFREYVFNNENILWIN